MRMLGVLICLSALPFACFALFAIVQPMIEWLNPQYESIPIRIEDEVATPWHAFSYVGRVSATLFLVGAVLLLATLNKLFRTWMQELTKNTAFTETGGGGDAS